MSNNFEKVKECPLCKCIGSHHLTEAKSIFTSNTHLKDTFDVVRCRACGFVYLGTRPTLGYIENYYGDDIAYYKLPDKHFIKNFPKSIKRIKKVLDVGFGGGAFLQKKYEEGWDCFGVDISKVAVKNGNKLNPKLKLTKGILKDANYPNEFFDMVNMHHVLEHDHDPVNLLKEVYRVLKKDGLLVIDVPNFGGLYYSLFGSKCEFFVPHHLSFFTRKTLSLVLDKAGFKNYKILNIFGNNTSYYILHLLKIQKSYYQKTIFNKFLGLFVYPIEMIFNKGDSLRAFVKKSL